MTTPRVVILRPTEDMPHSASVPNSQSSLFDSSSRKCAAQYLADMMRTGSCPRDRSFDRFLPEPLRLVSPEYWTPLAVAKRAADWLEDLGIRTAVDIGSGAGKFCVAAALFGKCRFIGLEQYSSLVRSAVALADLFDLNDRVSFVAGALGAVPTPVFNTDFFSDRLEESTQAVTTGSASVLGAGLLIKSGQSEGARDAVQKQGGGRYA